MPAIAIKDGHIEIFEEANVEHEDENRWEIAGRGNVKADYIVLLPDWR
ncbi:hypothetical protein [Natronorubrum thiooxidans]|uniref:Uncharacterized protein n=1 Tax=Natronorubrum thiooxidans TaxID=308853 RepID=A0A1N7D6Y9_9EURY|nr:hypothetical protein [Natronorubrum thiooxidans]SIR71514.1 hypothetical protein SAMN05421752_10216 [Natronorubrum thiooxidans]